MTFDQLFLGVITFVGGLFAGFLATYFKAMFDTEKTRFDFRMKVLRDLWGAVVYVRSLAANLDPIGDFIDSSEKPEDRIKRRLKEFFPAHLAAKRIVRFNEPFYPEELEAMASKVLLESISLARLVADESRRNRDNYYGKIGRRTKKLNALTDELRDAIRREVHRSPFVRPIDE